MQNRTEPRTNPQKPKRQRAERFNLRLTLAERTALNEVAAAEHLTPSAWLRRAAILARKDMR
jgi:hypothetical protein